MSADQRTGDSPGGRRPVPKRFEVPPLRPLLYVLLVSLLLFLLHDVLDKWLVGADPGLHRLVHLVGHVFSCLAVATLAGWLIIKNAQVFLAVSSPEVEWPSAGLGSEAERRKIFAEWFVAMRWVAVLLSGLLVFVSIQVVEWLPSEVWLPLMVTVAVLAATNFLYTALLQRNWHVPRLLQVQAYVDLVILVVLLHFSGGVENPFSLMMIFHVIIGGILLSRLQCYCIAGAAIALYAAMVWGEWAGVFGHYMLRVFPHFPTAGEALRPVHQTMFVLSQTTLHALVLCLTAYFATTLVERLRKHERQLAALADRATAGQQLLEQALETTGAALRVLNRDLQTHWANRRWLEWFPGAPNQPGDGPERPSQPPSPARQTLADKQVRVTEVALEKEPSTQGPGGDGAHPPVFQITTAPLLDGQGNVQRIVELAQDVTQQKRTQEQITHAGKLAAVGELAGRVAHEVNNPIAIISAKTRLLLADHGGEMSPKIAQELGKITDYADRVARIAQGLLSYCRPSPATRTRLDVRQPLRKSLAMVEPHARHSGVVVVDHLPAQLPLVTANANELEQIFLNLFLNALDAMPKGGNLTFTANDKARLSDGRPAIAVVVADTGVGIPEAIRSRIFEPFFTTKQEGRGTGLGLSICLGLVRSHGGEIDVESQPGHGTRFTVLLPATSSGNGGEGPT